MTTFPAPGFTPHIKVRSGRVQRELRVDVETAAKPNHRYPPVRREAAVDLLRAVAELVAAGGWASSGEQPSGFVVQLPGSGGRESFVVSLSASTPDVVRAMARSFEFLDVSGTRSVAALSIVERIPDDEAEATADDLTAPRPVTVPFSRRRAPVGDHEGKRVQVHVAFDRPDDDPALEATRSLFDAWGGALMLGAFPGPGMYPSAAGYVESVEPGLAHEVIVEMEHLFGTAAAWEPVYRGLARIHADVCPIREVRFS